MANNNHTNTTYIRKQDTNSRIKQDIHDVGGRVFTESVLPKIKDIIFSAVSIIVYGEDRTRGTSSSTIFKSQGGYTDFTAYSRPNANPNSNLFNVVGGTAKWRFEDPVFSVDVYGGYEEAKKEAARVLVQMNQIINQQGFIDINMFYDLAKVQVQVPYTMVDYGWVNVTSAGLRFVEAINGWIIELPPHKYIGNLKRR